MTEPTQRDAPVWGQLWAAADRIERAAWQLMGSRDRPAELLRDTGRVLVVEAAELNRLGFRLASDAIDRAAQR